MKKISFSSQTSAVVLLETLRSQEWIGILLIEKKQGPQDPSHKFQSTEESEEEPVITDPNIDLNINK